MATDVNTINQDAQELSSALGVSYQEPSVSTQDISKTNINSPPTAPTDTSALTGTTIISPTTSPQAGTEAPTTPYQSYIDAATGTVAGQLESLLSESSPYIQQARTQAAEQAQSRGLLNTTLAAQAGQQAAIAQALPIAQQAADVYSQEALVRQGQEFQAGQSALNRAHELELQQRNITSSELQQERELEQQTIQNQLNREFQRLMETSSQEFQTKYAELQNTFNVEMEGIRNQQDTMIRQMELNAQEASELRVASHQVMANYQQSVLQLLSDPTFLELSGADLNATIENMRNMAANQISFLGSMSQVDLTQFLETAFPSMEY